MITGKSAGSGKYSFQQASCANTSVMVTSMPEEMHKIRIAFQHMGETANPIMRLTMIEAELLWFCLNGMAKEFNWKDEVSK